ncbi:MAG TPA: ATP-binding protein, partial [Caulobacteraceae bacterium]|nr:ATP-binding protein [Caulobacteraceae bacterium]
SDIASSFRSATERAGLALNVEADRSLELVYVDHGMLEKIVLNLVSNAFKFTLEGAISVAVRAGQAPKTAEIVVMDTGVGIPGEEMPRLFERFHRVRGAKGRSFEGSGIGLALVQELVALHGGAIEVESREGEGSTFRVVLPLGRGHLPAEQVEDAAEALGETTAARAFVEEALRWLPDVQPSAAPEGDAIPGHGRGRTVLLADDNADMRDYVSRLLTASGFEVIAAVDGQAAREALAGRRPDLVLTDVMMPRLDGFGLLKAIRADPALADLPVIMLSARAGEDSAVEGLGAGADDYLSKPFAARELLARVGANLALAKARSDAAAAVATRGAELEAAHRQLQELNETLERRVAETLAERKVLAEVVAGADAFVQVVDLDFRWLAINRAAADEFERYFGVPPKVGASVLRTLADKPQYGAGLEALWRRALAGEAFTELVDLTDPAGERRCYEFKFDVLRGANGERIGAFQFIYDVTERMLEQERLAQAEEQLRQAQKMEAMGQLTGGVAHDFNNLLTPIIGGLDVLQRARIGGERERRLIDGALQSADRAKTLVQRLLAFARRQPLQPTAVDLGALVRGMADLVASTAGPQIRVVVEIEDDVAPARADQNQLEMALLNLAVNARDAMSGGGTIRISVANAQVRAGQTPGLAPGPYVRLSVADTGVGMDAATLARAVEPFFSTKGIGKGTGLGLSMVHGLMQQLGGALTIASRPGLGANVELWLPQSGEAPADSERSHAPVEPGSRRGLALLVDDEALVRASTADMLAELGYSVAEASSAEEALRRLDAGLKPAVVISDHLMPGMTGVDLARAVGARFPDVPVLIVSGYADMEGIEPDLARLTKPFLTADLSAALAEIG